MLTLNNERTVDRALASVTFADELVVVDSGSTDGTLDIARRYTDRIVHHDWPGFRDQYQYAQDQCSHDWVLFVDADEEISPLLATEIKATLTANDGHADGYNVHRRTFFVDRWILHGAWVRDSEIRLYRKARGCWKGDLHACVHVDGKVVDMRHFCYHYTYEDIADQIATLNRYSSIGAEDLKRQGKYCTLIKLIGNPVMGFLRDYVLRLGFLDGRSGLIIAVNTAVSTFNKYAKLWERHLAAEHVETGGKRKPE